MKTSIITLFAMIAGCRIVAAAGIFPPITTMDGKTYDHITAQRTDPDGLYIEYTLPGNGMGVAKVKFSRLSTRLRKLCGYDAEACTQCENDALAGVTAYQTWADQREAARKQAQAEAYAYQVEQAAIAAQHIPAPAPEQASSPFPHSEFQGVGWTAGGPNPFDTRTVVSFQDPDSQARLIGPSSFNRSFSAASPQRR